MMTCVRRALALGFSPCPQNVLVEMTDFMLICIYPALIMLQEMMSESLAFNATGWSAPTPACRCLSLRVPACPCLPLLA